MVVVPVATAVAVLVVIFTTTLLHSELSEGNTTAVFVYHRGRQLLLVVLSDTVLCG
jgi:hypothetical protein